MPRRTSRSSTNRAGPFRSIDRGVKSPEMKKNRPMKNDWQVMLKKVSAADVAVSRTGSWKNHEPAAP